MSGATDVYELVNFFEAQNTSYEVDMHATDKHVAEEAREVEEKVEASEETP